MSEERLVKRFVLAGCGERALQEYSDFSQFADACPRRRCKSDMTVQILHPIVLRWLLRASDQTQWLYRSRLVPEVVSAASL